MDKRTAVYPGSFDPITYGHINLVERAAERFDKIYVSVMNNMQKYYLFDLDERVKMTKQNLSHIPNIEVNSFSGLLVQYCKKNQIYTVLRGLRAVTDFEYELQMANGNRSLFPELEIFFLMADVAHSFISSSMVKEVSKHGGDVSTWVPPNVEDALNKKFNKH